MSVSSLVNPAQTTTVGACLSDRDSPDQIF